MDLQAVLAAAPFVRKAWKWTPAPLRIPLVAVGAGALVWKLVQDRDAADTPADEPGDLTATA